MLEVLSPNMTFLKTQRSFFFLTKTSVEWGKTFRYFNVIHLFEFKEKDFRKKDSSPDGK